MDDFERELKVGFLDEAEQLMSQAEATFLELESDPGNVPLLEKIFRFAHNLKGSSKAVGFSQMGEFTHKFESVLLKLKSGTIPSSKKSVSLMLKCTDQVNVMIQALRGNLDARVDTQALEATLDTIIGGDYSALSTDGATPAAQTSEPPQAEALASAPSADSVVVAASAPESQPLAAPQISSLEAVQKKKPNSTPAKSSSDESIRVGLEKIERLLNSVGEIVILESVIREQVSTDKPQLTLLRKNVHQLRKTVKEIQDLSLGMRMLPFKPMMQKLQRVVRDTADALSKEIEFVTLGEDVELDKTILEGISDPLVHLVRNAVDHGIESAEARVQNGKSARGKVVLSAYQKAGKIFIEIQDDGAGLDADRLIAKAIEKGILPPGQTLSEAEAYKLIFAPGFSTKQQVTEVSGRGVGMDVVRTNIEALQGDLEIVSKKGSGTTFKIGLPSSLAIIQGMIIRCGNQKMIVPLYQISEMIRLRDEDIHNIHELGKVIKLRGENVPLVPVASLFRFRGETGAPEAEKMAIIARLQNETCGFLVHDILGQSEIVVKPLTEDMNNLSGVSGTAILGDGKPALILELQEIMNLKMRGAA